MWKCGVGRQVGTSGGRGRGEAGLSLIEVLVAVAVLSLSIGGLTAGMLVSIHTSGDNGGRSLASTGLLAVTEHLKTATYTPCATATALNTAWGGPQTLPDGRSYEVQILSVQYWRLSTTPGRFEAGSCTTSGATRDGGAQLIQLRVTAAGTTNSGSVVVRNPGARP
ncbi:MAG: prepilin-type N-terminal cleavage/methylation domain-containing protein [Microthrixaceae bacterium]|nr:prepilin-type N-terminal cleavage/methylation domain-containing protein [Microthrixaceae bacterium]